jgi:hypothetical protein
MAGSETPPILVSIHILKQSRIAVNSNIFSNKARRWRTGGKRGMKEISYPGLAALTPAGPYEGRR